MKPIRTLVDLITEFPGVGPRQARRIVQFLLRTNQSYKRTLIDAIATLNDKVSSCKHCFRFDEVNENTLCSLCSDTSRDSALLMVVEKDVDIESVEASGLFKGYYFVLGSFIPLSQARKSAVPARTTELSRFVDQRLNSLKEIILAFATTPEGDHTAEELKKEIANYAPTIRVSMLGRGLSLGAEIEYADQETLRSALEGRA